MWGAQVVLVRVAALRSPASRSLLAATLHVTAVHPTAAADRLIAPLMVGPQCADEAPTEGTEGSQVGPERLGTAQAEVVIRLLKDGLPPEMVACTLQSILSSLLPKATAAGARTTGAWCEPSLHAWHSLLGQHNQLLSNGAGIGAAAVLGPLIQLLEPMVEVRKGSLKYCNVLFALVKHFGTQICALETELALAQRLESLLSRCTCFVRKPALAALAKVRAAAAAERRAK